MVLFFYCSDLVAELPFTLANAYETTDRDKKDNTTLKVFKILKLFNMYEISSEKLITGSFFSIIATL